jgi:superfamily II DNA or RNA helicase
MRRRFTQRQRTELWLASYGCCAICGKKLDISYHIDHSLPWSKGGLTINQNGEAVCVKCNQQKGINMLRSHQQQFIDVCRRIKTTESLRKVIALVVPGGGKSALPVIAANELIPYIGDGIAWIAPRRNLLIQAETAFTDTWLRSIIRHNNEIRSSTNEADLLRGKIGYCSTNQALVAARAFLLNSHVELFKQRRMILFLDEPHHIALDEEFYLSVEPLVKLCHVLVLMSGCLSRHDNKSIGFLDYLALDKERRSYVDLNESERQTVIKYGLRDATREHAIIKINFELKDCSADWEIEDQTGNIIFDGNINSFETATKEQTSKGLWSALSTEFFESLLYDAAEYWRERRKHNSSSSFLVVCASIPRAQKAMQLLKKMGLNVDIATSDEADAQIRIERFRNKERPHLDALVTVAMAYEGMDAPSADVLVCLTHIRSKEWIEQMIHRVTRYDRENSLPWEHQFATIFAPKDRFFLDIMAEMQAEQAPFVKEAACTTPPPPKVDTKMRPGQSEMTDSTAHTFDEAPIKPVDHKVINEALKSADILGAIPTTAGLKFFEAMKAAQSAQSVSPTGQTAVKEDVEPPSKREKKLRNKISEFQRRGYDPNDSATTERIRNRGNVMWRQFGKHLDQCTEEEMKAIWNNRNYWGNP